MLEWSCLQTCWYSGLEMLKTCFNRLKHVKTLKFDDVAVVGVKIQNSQKKMEKWGFQGVYVCMLLVMILCWGSMFHLHLWCFFRWGFGGNFDAKVMCQCLVFDEGDNCLGCWGLCFGSDEGDTVDTVLVVVAFWLSRYVLSFFGYDFIVFPYHQFQDRTFNSISFIRFHVFQHLSFFILSFSSFLVAFFLGCVLIWTSFASPRFLRTSSWTFWILSGAPRWDVRAVSFAWKHHFWGHIAVLEALCTLYVHIVALHYTQRCWLLSPAADWLTNAHKIRWVLLAACVALWTSQRIKKS